MEAAEARVQKILEGSKQFLVPHYQRPYSWQEKQWATLWSDVLELVADPESQPHFLGSVVTSPARSVPEGVEKRLLIDGQQRLTTLLVLLTLLRDRSRDAGLTRLAARIQDLITNPHEDGNERFKLLPTQGEDPGESDRETFVRLVESVPISSDTGIAAAYAFFDKKLRRDDAPDLEVLFRTLTMRLTLVSIILGDHDNPHRIFESLNGKGRPLSQADLIRNYFFMRIHEREHERAYKDHWRPMQRRVGEEALTDFVRHYLMRSGQLVRETDVYAELKSRIDAERPFEPARHLKDLARFAEFYALLLRPEGMPVVRIQERLARLNRLEVTVAYPFLLSVLADRAEGRLSDEQTVAVLDAVEGYVIRRFVCGVPTHGLNKVFPPLHATALRAGGDFVGAVKATLAASPRNYPRDAAFRERLKTARLYGGGERRDKTRLILDRLEAAHGHKEAVSGDALTMEHVMPQELTDAWREQLGPDAEETHEDLLHTLGNLTLTSYNPELGNSTFDEKKRVYAASHLELNRYFAGCERWDADAIERRADALADAALTIWPYFGPSERAAEVSTADVSNVTGTVPLSVQVRGKETPTQSWVDVAVATMEGVISVGHEEFMKVVAELPRFVNVDATVFRRSSRLRKLSNGGYVETNLSASSIYRACMQAAQIAGLAPTEWRVSLAQLDHDSDDDADNGEPSPVKQRQHEFWVYVREALSKTGQFPSLRPAKPQYWFNIAIGRSDVELSLTANTDDRRVGVKINLKREGAAAMLEQLMAQRGAIERELGVAPQWDPFPDKRWKTIVVTRPCDVADSSQWQGAAEWLTSMAIAFRSAFGPRIAAIDAGVRT